MGMLCTAALFVVSSSQGEATEPAVTNNVFGKTSVADYARTLKHKPAINDLTRLGKALFLDRSLSASGQMACATCHDPAHGFSPGNKLDVQLGGPHLNLSGKRATPALRYLQTIPVFTEHFFENDGNDSVDAGPTGGLMLDGRVDNLHKQAGLPLLSPLEMANKSSADVVEKIKAGSNAKLFKQVLGDDIFNSTEDAFFWATMALEAFQQNPIDFYPYSSKYDDFLRGKVQLSKQELRGLEAFNNPQKGNCASCHISKKSSVGVFPQFTDYGLIALGVPRNRKLSANADKKYFDLGLCGPERSDLKKHSEYCGLFRTPSLRNVAVRQTFFHNGSFHSLGDVIRFYVTRDIQPEKWYPAGADGKVNMFDDLPPQYYNNVNREAPFSANPAGKVRLSDREIADMLAFMKTLTDRDLLKIQR